MTTTKLAVVMAAAGLMAMTLSCNGTTNSPGSVVSALPVPTPSNATGAPPVTVPSIVAPSPTSAGALAPAASIVAPNFADFVGVWLGHGRQLAVQAKGVADLAYRTYRTCGQDPPPCDDFAGNPDGGQMMLQFTRATPPFATGHVTQSNDPIHQNGTLATATLMASDDALELTLGSYDFGLFCGPHASPGFCGA